jgi:hypothetical protein
MEARPVGSSIVAFAGDDETLRTALLVVMMMGLLLLLLVGGREVAMLEVMARTEDEVDAMGAEDEVGGAAVVETF